MEQGHSAISTTKKTQTKKESSFKSSGTSDGAVRYKLLSGRELVFDEDDVRKPGELEKRISEALGCKQHQVSIVGRNVVVLNKGKGKGKEKEGGPTRNKSPPEFDCEAPSEGSEDGPEDGETHDEWQHRLFRQRLGFFSAIFALRHRKGLSCSMI